jgi:hypothetical protein
MLFCIDSPETKRSTALATLDARDEDDATPERAQRRADPRARAAGGQARRSPPRPPKYTPEQLAEAPL